MATDLPMLSLLAWAVPGVAAGWLALGWVRPQRQGVSPPHVMLALGFAGMLLGLLFDLHRAGAAQLGSVCARLSTLGLLDALWLHLRFLPGMHAGMLAGGLLAIPLLRRLRPRCKRWLCSLFAQNLLCSGWMLLGMTWGGLWVSRLPLPLGASLGADTLPGMLSGMLVGMTWGMVASVALYRSFFAWRKHVEQSRERRAARAASAT